MDRYISRFESEADGDLRLCRARGLAYQADMTPTISYGDAYHDHYKALEGSDIATRLNAGRCAMLTRHATPGASVLDFGAGAGTFVEAAQAWGFDAKGFDIIPKTVDALRARGAYADDPGAVEVVTFWDSLEHLPDPGAVLDRIRRGAVVLVAIPIIGNLDVTRQSKHFKPGEHLFYWTAWGFVEWMAMYGFRIVDSSTHETDAGRDGIGAFAFRRDAPARCPCGGLTYVDEFLWPRRALEFFQRCESCGGMSDAVKTKQEAEALTIRCDQAGGLK